MGKSPGKWIKTKLFGKKSSKSTLSKDATLEKKTSISKASSKDFNDDSMVISSPVPPVVMHASEEHTVLEKTSSVNLTNGTSEVAGSTTGLKTGNEDESIRLEQAAIKAQAAYRGYLARRSFSSLKGIILLQAHIRGHLTRKQLQPNPKGNLVISTKTEKPKPTLTKASTHQPESIPEQPHSELEKVKQSLRKISISMAAASEKVPPHPEPEPEPEPEQGPAQPEPEPEPEHEPEPEPEPEVAMNVESNGKENVKTRRRRSLPAKQEDHVEIVLLQKTPPVLPSYMAATESAKAKLRAQAVAEDGGGENGFIRRHSLPSSTGKLSLQSPRVQKPTLQANGNKGWIKSNKPQICSKDDKMVQTGWKR